MTRYSSIKSLAFAAGAALAICSSSAAMAQNASVDPTSTQAGTFGPANGGGTWPVYGQVFYGQYGVSGGTGNGAAFVAAGTGNSNRTGVVTQAPDSACTTLPGTDIPYECQ